MSIPADLDCDGVIDAAMGSSLLNPHISEEAMARILTSHLPVATLSFTPQKFDEVAAKKNIRARLELEKRHWPADVTNGEVRRDFVFALGALIAQLQRVNTTFMSEKRALSNSFEETFGFSAGDAEHFRWLLLNAAPEKEEIDVPDSFSAPAVTIATLQQLATETITLLSKRVHHYTPDEELLITAAAMAVLDGMPLRQQVRRCELSALPTRQNSDNSEHINIVSTVTLSLSAQLAAICHSMAPVGVSEVAKAARRFPSELGSRLLAAPSFSSPPPSSPLPSASIDPARADAPTESLAAGASDAAPIDARRVLAHGIRLHPLTSTASIDPARFETRRSANGLVTLAAFGAPVRSGKWYFEATVLSREMMQIGIVTDKASFDASSGYGVGNDSYSWGWCGNRHEKFHGRESSSSSSGDRKYPGPDLSAKHGSGPIKQWTKNDIVGVLLDLDKGELSFSLNGKQCGVAFTHVKVEDKRPRVYMPAVSFSNDRGFRFNFGSVNGEDSSTKGGSATSTPSAGSGSTTAAVKYAGSRSYGFAHPPTATYLPWCAAAYGGQALLDLTPPMYPPHALLLRSAMEASTGVGSGSIRALGLGSITPSPEALPSWEELSTSSYKKAHQPVAVDANNRVHILRPYPLTLRTKDAGALLVVHDHEDFKHTENFCFETVCCPDSVAVPQILGIRGDDADGGWRLVVLPGGRLRFMAHSSNQDLRSATDIATVGGYLESASGVVEAGTWQHLAVVVTTSVEPSASGDPTDKQEFVDASGRRTELSFCGQVVHLFKNGQKVASGALRARFGTPSLLPKNVSLPKPSAILPESTPFTVIVKLNSCNASMYMLGKRASSGAAAESFLGLFAYARYWGTARSEATLRKYMHRMAINSGSSGMDVGIADNRSSSVQSPVTDASQYSNDAPKLLKLANELYEEVADLKEDSWNGFKRTAGTLQVNESVPAIIPVILYENGDYCSTLRGGWDASVLFNDSLLDYSPNGKHSARISGSWELVDAFTLADATNAVFAMSPTDLASASAPFLRAAREAARTVEVITGPRAATGAGPNEEPDAIEYQKVAPLPKMLGADTDPASEPSEGSTQRTCGLGEVWPSEVAMTVICAHSRVCTMKDDAVDNGRLPHASELQATLPSITADVPLDPTVRSFRTASSSPSAIRALVALIKVVSTGSTRSVRSALKAALEVLDASLGNLPEDEVVKQAILSPTAEGVASVLMGLRAVIVQIIYGPRDLDGRELAEEDVVAPARQLWQHHLGLFYPSPIERQHWLTAIASGDNDMIRHYFPELPDCSIDAVRSDAIVYFENHPAACALAIADSYKPLYVKAPPALLQSAPLNVDAWHVALWGSSTTKDAAEHSMLSGLRDPIVFGFKTPTTAYKTPARTKVAKKESPTESSELSLSAMFGGGDDDFEDEAPVEDTVVAPTRVSEDMSDVASRSCVPSAVLAGGKRHLQAHWVSDSANAILNPTSPAVCRLRSVADADIDKHYVSSSIAFAPHTPFSWRVSVACSDVTAYRLGVVALSDAVREPDIDGAWLCSHGAVIDNGVRSEHIDISIREEDTVSFFYDGNCHIHIQVGDGPVNRFFLSMINSHSGSLCPVVACVASDDTVEMTATLVDNTEYRTPAAASSDTARAAAGNADEVAAKLTSLHNALASGMEDLLTRLLENVHLSDMSAIVSILHQSMTGVSSFSSKMLSTTMRLGNASQHDGRVPERSTLKKLRRRVARQTRCHSLLRAAAPQIKFLKSPASTHTGDDAVSHRFSNLIKGMVKYLKAGSREDSSADGSVGVAAVRLAQLLRGLHDNISTATSLIAGQDAERLVRTRPVIQLSDAVAFEYIYANTAAAVNLQPDRLEVTQPDFANASMTLCVQSAILPITESDDAAVGWEFKVNAASSSGRVAIGILADSRQSCVPQWITVDAHGVNSTIKTANGDSECKLIRGLRQGDIIHAWLSCKDGKLHIVDGSSQSSLLSAPLPIPFARKAAQWRFVVGLFDVGDSIRSVKFLDKPATVSPLTKKKVAFPTVQSARVNDEVELAIRQIFAQPEPSSSTSSQLHLSHAFLDFMKQPMHLGLMSLMRHTLRVGAQRIRENGIGASAALSDLLVPQSLLLLQLHDVAGSIDIFEQPHAGVQGLLEDIAVMRDACHSRLGGTTLDSHSPPVLLTIMDLCVAAIARITSSICVSEHITDTSFHVCLAPQADCPQPATSDVALGLQDKVAALRQVNVAAYDWVRSDLLSGPLRQSIFELFSSGGSDADTTLGMGTFSLSRYMAATDVKELPAFIQQLVDGEEGTAAMALLSCMDQLVGTGGIRKNRMKSPELDKLGRIIVAITLCASNTVELAHAFATQAVNSTARPTTISLSHDGGVVQFAVDAVEAILCCMFYAGPKAKIWASSQLREKGGFQILSSSTPRSITDMGEMNAVLMSYLHLVACLQSPSMPQEQLVRMCGHTAGERAPPSFGAPQHFARFGQQVLAFLRQGAGLIHPEVLLLHSFVRDCVAARKRSAMVELLRTVHKSSTPRQAAVCLSTLYSVLKRWAGPEQRLVFVGSDPVLLNCTAFGQAVLGGMPSIAGVGEITQASAFPAARGLIALWQMYPDNSTGAAPVSLSTPQTNVKPVAYAAQTPAKAEQAGSAAVAATTPEHEVPIPSALLRVAAAAGLQSRNLLNGLCDRRVMWAALVASTNFTQERKTQANGASYQASLSHIPLLARREGSSSTPVKHSSAAAMLRTDFHPAAEREVAIHAKFDSSGKTQTNQLLHDLASAISTEVEAKISFPPQADTVDVSPIRMVPIVQSVLAALACVGQLISNATTDPTINAEAIVGALLSSMQHAQLHCHSLQDVEAAIALHLVEKAKYVDDSETRDLLLVEKLSWLPAALTLQNCVRLSFAMFGCVISKLAAIVPDSAPLTSALLGVLATIGSAANYISVPDLLTSVRGRFHADAHSLAALESSPQMRGLFNTIAQVETTLQSQRQVADTFDEFVVRGLHALRVLILRDGSNVDCNAAMNRCALIADHTANLDVAAAAFQCMAVAIDRLPEGYVVDPTLRAADLTSYLLERLGDYGWSDILSSGKRAFFRSELTSLLRTACKSRTIGAAANARIAEALVQLHRVLLDLGVMSVDEVMRQMISEEGKLSLSANGRLLMQGIAALEVAGGHLETPRPRGTVTIRPGFAPVADCHSASAEGHSLLCTLVQQGNMQPPCIVDHADAGLQWRLASHFEQGAGVATLSAQKGGKTVYHRVHEHDIDAVQLPFDAKTLSPEVWLAVMDVTSTIGSAAWMTIPKAAVHTEVQSAIDCKFAPELSSLFSFEKEGRVVKNNSSGHVIVDCPITKGRWVWECKLVKDEHGSETTCFGFMAKPFTDSYRCPNGWFYRCYNGYLYKQGNEDRKGKQQIHPGDTVRMEYDADAGTVSYSVSGVDQGVCFTEVTGEIYPAVVFYGSPREVESVSLQRVDVPMSSAPETSGAPELFPSRFVDVEEAMAFDAFPWSMAGYNKESVLHTVGLQLRSNVAHVMGSHLLAACSTAAFRSLASILRLPAAAAMLMSTADSKIGELRTTLLKLGAQVTKTCGLDELPDYELLYAILANHGPGFATDAFMAEELALADAQWSIAQAALVAHRSGRGVAQSKVTDASLSELPDLYVSSLPAPPPAAAKRNLVEQLADSAGPNTLGVNLSLVDDCMEEEAGSDAGEFQRFFQDSRHSRGRSVEHSNTKPAGPTAWHLIGATSHADALQLVAGAGRVTTLPIRAKSSAQNYSVMVSSRGFGASHFSQCLRSVAANLATLLAREVLSLLLLHIPSSTAAGLAAPLKAPALRHVASIDEVPMSSGLTRGTSAFSATDSRPDDCSLEESTVMFDPSILFGADMVTSFVSFTKLLCARPYVPSWWPIEAEGYQYEYPKPQGGRFPAVLVDRYASIIKTIEVPSGPQAGLTLTEENLSVNELLRPLFRRAATAEVVLRQFVRCIAVQLCGTATKLHLNQRSLDEVPRQADDKIDSDAQFGFAQYLTETILDCLRTNGDIGYSAKIAQYLVEAWVCALRSPLIAVKSVAFRRIIEILEAFRTHVAVSDPSYQQRWQKLLRSLPTERILAMAKRRLDREREEAPRFSRYLQVLLELSALLQLQEAEETIDDESASAKSTIAKPRFYARFHENDDADLDAPPKYAHIQLNHPCTKEVLAPWTVEAWVRLPSKISPAAMPARTDCFVPSVEFSAAPGSPFAGLPPAPALARQVTSVGDEPICVPDSPPHQLRRVSSIGANCPFRVLLGGPRSCLLLDASTYAEGASAQAGTLGVLVGSATQGRAYVEAAATGKLPPTNVFKSFGCSIPHDQWVHLAYVCVGQNMFVFINGVHSGSITVGSNLPLPLSAVGCRDGNSFIGDLHEVRIWRVVRTPGEIRRDMATTLSPTRASPGLMAYFDFIGSAPQSKYVSDASGQLTKCVASNITWHVSRRPPSVVATPEAADPLISMSDDGPKQPRAEPVGEVYPGSFDSLSFQAACVFHRQPTSKNIGEMWIREMRSVAHVSWTEAPPVAQFGGTISNAFGEAIRSCRAQIFRSLHARQAKALMDSDSKSGAETEGYDDESQWLLSGTLELPESLVRVRLVGIIEPRPEGYLQGRSFNEPRQVKLYVSDIIDGPPDTMSWLCSLVLDGSISGEQLSLNWSGSVDALEVEVGGSSASMRVNPSLKGTSLRLSDGGSLVEHLGGSSWGTAVCNMQLPPHLQAEWRGTAKPVVEESPGSRSRGDMRRTTRPGQPFDRSMIPPEVLAGLGDDLSDADLEAAMTAMRDLEAPGRGDDGEWHGGDEDGESWHEEDEGAETHGDVDDLSRRIGLSGADPWMDAAGLSGDVPGAAVGGGFSQALSKGKVVWEVRIEKMASDFIGIGAATYGTNLDYYLGGDDSKSWSFQLTKETWYRGSSRSFGEKPSKGAVIGVEADMDNGTIEYLINGRSIGFGFENMLPQLYNVIGSNPPAILPAVSLYNDDDAVRIIGLKAGFSARTYHTEKSGERAKLGGWYKFMGHWKDGQQHGPGLLFVKAGFPPSGADHIAGSGRSWGPKSGGSTASQVFTQLKTAAHANLWPDLPASQDPDEAGTKDGETDVCGFWVGDWQHGEMTGTFRWYGCPSSTTAAQTLSKLPDEVKTFLTGAPADGASAELPPVARSLTAFVMSSSPSGPGPHSAGHYQLDKGAVVKRLSSAELDAFISVINLRAAAVVAPAPSAVVSHALEKVKITVPVQGRIAGSADKLFLFMPSQSGNSIKLSSDLETVRSVSSSSSIVLGSRGFSSGIHYWEVFVDKAQWGDVYIGVAERSFNTLNPLPQLPLENEPPMVQQMLELSGGPQPQLNTWRDYGWINYMAVSAPHTGEKIYGNFFSSGDRVGVLLNMDAGTLSFVKDSVAFDEHKVDIHDVAFHHVRTGSTGGPTSKMLFPMIGLKKTGDVVSINHHRWISRPGVPSNKLMGSMLEAANALRCWDWHSRVDLRLSDALLQDAYRHFSLMREVSMGAGELPMSTRASVQAPFDRSPRACKHALLASGASDALELQAGDRIRTDRGEGTIVGAYRNRLWYILDSFPDHGAWYFTGADFEDAMAVGMAAVLDKASTPASPIMDVDVSFEEFCDCAHSSAWTLQRDEELVRIANALCDKAGISPELLLISHPTAADGSFAPEWLQGGDAGVSLKELRARYSLLVALNMRVGELLPLVDLTVKRSRGLITTDSKAIEFPSMLGERLTRLRGLIFTRTKQRYWDSVLKATIDYTQPAQELYDRPEGFPEVKMSRIKARPEILARYTSRSERMKHSIFGQIMEKARSWPDSAFRKAYSHVQDGGQQRCFFVKFVGEGVDDNGGPYRAAVQAATSSEPIESLGMLSLCQNGIHQCGENRDQVVFPAQVDDDDSSAAAADSSPSALNPRLLQEFRFFGLLAGMAVRNKIQLPINFSALVMRPLVSLPVRFQDIALTDTRLTELVDILLGMTPSGPCDASGARTPTADDLAELRMHGEAIVSNIGPIAPPKFAQAVAHLNFNNRRLFANYARSLAARRGHSALFFESFFNGFSGVLPAELFPLFTPDEFEVMLCGKANIDLDVLRKATIYEFLTPTTPQVVWLWEILADFNQAQRVAFVNFVTARSRIPQSADAFIQPFRIEAASGAARERPDLYLPKTQTCFSKLTIALTSNKEILRSKLMYAMENAVTMDADVRSASAEGYEMLK